MNFLDSLPSNGLTLITTVIFELFSAGLLSLDVFLLSEPPSTKIRLLNYGVLLFSKMSSSELRNLESNEDLPALFRMLDGGDDKRD